MVFLNFVFFDEKISKKKVDSISIDVRHRRKRER